MSSVPSINTYKQLLSRVKETLLEGRQRIEQERVKIYWQTGHLIYTDILKHKGRAEYGTRLFNRLSKDLGIEVSLIQRCVQFVKTYPELPNSVARRNFTWTHFRKLITVSDDKTRAKLEKAAIENDWTTEELARRIKKAKPSVQSKAKAKAAAIAVLEPRVRGEFYTYTTYTPPEVFAVTGEVMADCGFNISRQVMVRDWPQAHFKAKMAYTYRAAPEKVVDGDTLRVTIDLGLGIYTRQKLRLRAIDCPEIATKAGQKAKAFVEQALKGAKTIALVSSKSDKYDRYLADVWVGETYLNQELLNVGLAEVWK